MTRGSALLELTSLSGAERRGRAAALVARSSLSGADGRHRALLQPPHADRRPRVEEVRKAALVNREAVEALLDAWLAGLRPVTATGYRQALEGFARQCVGPAAGPADLFVSFAADPVEVTAAVCGYADGGGGADKANTRRRKLSALSSAHRALRRGGMALPPLRFKMPPRDQDREAVATEPDDRDRALAFLSRRDRDIEVRSAAAIALAAAGLQTAEIVALPIDAFRDGAPVVMVGADPVELAPPLEAAVGRWWGTLGPGSGRAFPVTARTLQRDVERVADALAPTLTLEGVRRRAIVTWYLEAGTHYATALGRTTNPAFVKRLVEAAGEIWEPDRPPTGPGRGPAPRT